MKSFNYHQSIKISYWGCAFDSLLEVKYVLSIQNEYEFLRSYIPIYFDPRTRMPTDSIRRNILRYTPDFLIRHKISKQAFLVEIKQCAFDDYEQLILRREVAENYIRWKKYDWSFKVVFGDEIKLRGDAQAKFVQCCKLMPGSDRKLRFQQLNLVFDGRLASLTGGALSNHRIQFVLFGG